MTQRKGHFEGQGLPQRMGTPYYPSLSLLPLTVGIWSPSSVSHQGIVEAAAPAPVKPSDDMMTGISTIEGIDLDADVPCDVETCDARADYKVKRHCPGCGTAEWGRGIGPHTRLPCHPHWVAASGVTSLRRCGKCGCAGAKGDFYRIVEVLR